MRWRKSKWKPFSLDRYGIFWSRWRWRRFIRRYIHCGLAGQSSTAQEVVEGFERARMLDRSQDKYPFFTFMCPEHPGQDTTLGGWAQENGMNLAV